MWLLNVASHDNYATAAQIRPALCLLLLLNLDGRICRVWAHSEQAAPLHMIVVHFKTTSSSSCRCLLGAK